jgi:hypothetical protein
MDEFRLAGASTNALRKGSAYYCPKKRTNKDVHQIRPGKKLAEVSYMAYSNQIFNGKAKVVW